MNSVIHIVLTGTYKNYEVNSLMKREAIKENHLCLRFYKFGKYIVPAVNIVLQSYTLVTDSTLVDISNKQFMK